jgi:hypothetical protein
MRGHQRSFGHAVKSGGDVGAEAGTGGHSAQRRRHRAVDLAGGDAERGDRMHTDPQFPDENVQCPLQRR